MAINRVQQAVEEYERVAREAAKTYEETLRKAELDLRAAMSSADAPEPPSEAGTVTMSRDDFEQLQDQLKKVSEFVKAHPELG